VFHSPNYLSLVINLESTSFLFYFFPQELLLAFCFYCSPLSIALSSASLQSVLYYLKKKLLVFLSFFFSNGGISNAGNVPKRCSCGWGCLQLHDVCALPTAWPLGMRQHWCIAAGSWKGRILDCAGAGKKCESWKVSVFESVVPTSFLDSFKSFAYGRKVILVLVFFPSHFLILFRGGCARKAVLFYLRRFLAS